MDDQEIKVILENAKTIAMIGISSEKKKEDPNKIKRKPANVVMKYMQDFGYKVIPINPFAEGEIINGEKVLSGLDKAEGKIDIVDVFRPSKEIPDIAKQVVRIGAKVLWLQYGIHHIDAENMVKKENIKYISNRCIKQEYQKIFQKTNPVYPVLKN
ncbi:MAG: CoA-binding protein [Candidatus Pelagibacter sp. TMED118]|nr:MAG: CoA-binding protein [Candidatus Pelagibacter sp. TMED118]|tara:strand:+ start:2114 stop:2581 length:468 start_codon:yes stop_codon:yes gene_type:complete